MHLLEQLEQMDKMGPIDSVLEMLPGLAGKVSKDDIDQLWAQAYYSWSEGESLVLEGELEEEALRIQLSHTEGGELVGLIEEYLDAKGLKGVLHLPFANLPRANKVFLSI